MSSPSSRTKAARIRQGDQGAVDAHPRQEQEARGEGTEFIIEEIDFDREVPDYLLTKAALRK